jgi:hypothetical protein
MNQTKRLIINGFVRFQKVEMAIIGRNPKINKE